MSGSTFNQRSSMNNIRLFYCNGNWQMVTSVFASWKHGEKKKTVMTDTNKTNGEPLNPQ